MSLPYSFIADTFLVFLMAVLVLLCMKIDHAKQLGIATQQNALRMPDQQHTLALVKEDQKPLMTKMTDRSREMRVLLQLLELA